MNINPKEFIEIVKSKLNAFNLPVFYSEKLLSGRPDVLSWNFDNTDINDLWRFIEKAKPSYCILYSSSFNLEEELNSEDISKNELSNNLKELSQKLEKYSNDILETELGFFVDGQFFVVVVNHELYWEIDEFKNALQENPYDDEEIEEEDEIPVKKFSQEEINEFVKELINQEEFRVCSKAYDRDVYAYEYFENRLNADNIVQISKKAEKELDKYFREQVRTLKSQKLTKVKISSQLGISIARVNKYF